MNTGARDHVERERENVYVKGGRGEVIRNERQNYSNACQSKPSSKATRRRKSHLEAPPLREPGVRGHGEDRVAGVVYGKRARGQRHKIEGIELEQPLRHVVASELGLREVEDIVAAHANQGGVILGRRCHFPVETCADPSFEI